jgi:hypothetical protein
MLEKFILKNKQTQLTKKYKSIKEISKDLNIDYFQVRAVYVESKKPKKFLHPITKHLCDKYEIIDNPELFN